MEQRKEGDLKPEMVKHELLRDITAGNSGSGHGNCGFGNGGNDGVPGKSGCQDYSR